MNIDPKHLHNAAVLRAIAVHGADAPLDSPAFELRLAFEKADLETSEEGGPIANEFLSDWLAAGRIIPGLVYKHGSDFEAVRRDLLEPETLMQFVRSRFESDSFRSEWVKRYVDGWNNYRNRL